MLNVDSYTPDQIAKRVEAAAEAKGKRDSLTTFVLALLAGAFIAFGAILFTVATHDPLASVGLTKVFGGLTFCLGLILVVIAGAELFTGNNLLVMAAVEGRLSLFDLLKNWVVVYIGNFIGALFIVVLISLSDHWKMNHGAVGEHALLIAQSKISLSFIAAFARGVLCNTLVCLAVWLCFAGRSVTDKILAIIFPITAFVALGFEHSVANMYFIPAGMLLAPDQIHTSDFLLNNLLPVTLGNIIGGSVFVALIYWFVYLRAKSD